MVTEPTGVAARSRGADGAAPPLDVEVCIISYGSAEQLDRCLASLHRIPGRSSVSVREHAADGSSETVVRSHGISATVRWEHDPSNPGFAAGCNASAARSDAEWLLFLNPDAQLLAWPWDPVPDGAAVVGAWITGDGHPSRHFGCSWRVSDEIARSWLRRSGAMPHRRGFVSGAAMLVRRDVFERLGGFDEGFFMYYEDVDFCLRAGEAGYDVRVEPAFAVHHDGGHAAWRDPATAILRSYRSAIRFRSLHGGVSRYRLYVLVDSVLRGARAAARGRTGVARAYFRLARVTLRDPDCDESGSHR
jgi:N-acetylglucosaminyl-diphospho-decaprenol L-rhamnosyltransferase